MGTAEGTEQKKYKNMVKEVDDMARTKVVTTPMFKYKRSAPKGEFIGWGFTAIRKATTEATSPRLLKFRSCVAGAMKGKSGSLKDIQEAFRGAAHACK